MEDISIWLLLGWEGSGRVLFAATVKKAGTSCMSTHCQHVGQFTCRRCVQCLCLGFFNRVWAGDTAQTQVPQTYSTAQQLIACKSCGLVFVAEQRISFSWLRQVTRAATQCTAVL